MQQPYQPLPPVKVITETVEVEIYQPPLPPQITLSDIDWKVITNTPCKPATGTTKVIGSSKTYNTTERFAYEDYTKEDGTSARRVQRDAEGNRIELPQLLDTDGKGIEVCGNLEQKIAEVENMLDGGFVVLAITPVGYEKMAANLQDIKRYINQQKEIIFYYREATKPKGKDGWLEENEERQDNQVEAEEANNEQQYTPPVADQPQEETGFSIKKLLPFGSD
jgi:hypothetical protein